VTFKFVLQDKSSNNILNNSITIINNCKIIYYFCKNHWGDPYFMKLEVQIKMNSSLYLRDPEQSDLGKNIIKYSIELIHQIGFEAFTFKKLAEAIGTTEAGVYRYFENKHKLLVYILSWYWGWLQFQINYQTNNIKDPLIKLKKVITILSTNVEDDLMTGHVDESMLYQIVIAESSKAYLTNHVGIDNQQEFFKPYKDLCNAVSDIILECNPKYKYPHSLASTIIEMAHLQNFFMNHLPSLTDFSKAKDESLLIKFLEDLVFKSISN
jgi:AcrR family transcriptional regulator